MSKSKIVTEFFPGVTHIKDAPEPISIEITEEENQKAKLKDHRECAMAVACKEQQNADGVIISISRAYLIFGDTAIRYELPESTRREVVSFDRGAGFATGVYQLGKPGKLMGKRNYPKRRKRARKPHFLRAHHTTGIRTTLGSVVTGHQ